jgi:hypothetical protein
MRRWVCNWPPVWPQSARCWGGCNVVQAAPVCVPRLQVVGMVHGSAHCDCRGLKRIPYSLLGICYECGKQPYLLPNSTSLPHGHMAQSITLMDSLMMGRGRAPLVMSFHDPQSAGLLFQEVHERQHGHARRVSSSTTAAANRCQAGTTQLPLRQMGSDRLGPERCVCVPHGSDVSTQTCHLGRNGSSFTQIIDSCCQPLVCVHELAFAQVARLGKCTCLPAVTMGRHTGVGTHTRKAWRMSVMSIQPSS